MEKPKISISGVLMTPKLKDRAFINELKQKLFLFDNVGFRDVKSYLEHFKKEDESTLKELESLINSQVIFDTSQLIKAMSFEQKEKGGVQVFGYVGMWIPTEFMTEPADDCELTQLLRILMNSKTLLEIHSEVDARMSAIMYNKYFHNKVPMEFYPLLQCSDLPQFNNAKVNVQNILFENIPIPYPDTPIEHIIEFRSNPDNRDRLLAFRNLINELSHSGYNEIEIKQKIEYLTEVYKSALDKHKIKFGEGVLDIVSTAFTNPLALPGKIFNGVMSTYNSSVNLAKAEMSFPGREISYLYKAKQQFKPE